MQFLMIVGGLFALIVPLIVNIQLIRQEVPIMIGATLLMLLLTFGARVRFADAALLLGLMIAYTVFLVVQSRRQNRAAQDTRQEAIGPAAAATWDRSLPVQVGLVLAGLVALVLGSRWLVEAAVACVPVLLTGREIARWEDAVFVLYSAAYVAYLILAAQQHDELRTYTLAITGFALPLTVVTLRTVLLRRKPPTG